MLIIHTASGCCNQIEVRQYSDCNHMGCLVLVAQPQIFTTYTIDQDNVIDGKAYYTSQDGRYAMVYTNSDGGRWLIQRVEDM